MREKKFLSRLIELTPQSVTRSAATQITAGADDRSISVQKIQNELSFDPIESDEQDLLGRSRFAEMLANTLATDDAPDGEVVAIYGSWGSGKSSIKNMCLSYLNKIEGRPEYKEFRTWDYSKQDQLANCLFEVIGGALGRSSSSELRQAAKQLSVYQATCNNEKFVAATFAQNTALIISLAGMIFGAFVPQLQGFVCALLGIVVIVYRFRERIFEWLAKDTGNQIELFKKMAESLECNTDEARAELENLLKKSKKSLLIIIDDLDRLDKDELKNLMRVVKANLNLPKLKFLLLFDQTIVSKALSSTGQEEEGRKYLEKIVRTGFEVPQLNKAELARLFDRELRSLAARRNVVIDEIRWKECRAAILSFISNLRELIRFILTLDFTLRMLHVDGVLTVDLIDVICLETLRMFNKDFFSQIVREKAVFTFSKDMKLQTVSETQVSDMLDKLVATVGIHATATARIISTVFPNLAFCFGPDFRADTERQKDRKGWFQHHRVCHPRIFDRYFSLSLAPDDILEVHIRAAFRPNDRFEIVNNLVKYAKQSMLGQFLNRMDFFEITAEDEELALPIIISLMDTFDLVLEEDDTQDSSDAINKDLYLDLVLPDIHALRIIRRVLDDLDSSKRYAVLKEALEKTHGLYLPCAITTLRGSKKENLIDITDDQQAELRNIALQKILDASETILQEHPDVCAMLEQWRILDGPTTPKNWFLRKLSNSNTKESLLSKGFLKPSQNGKMLLDRNKLLEIASEEEFKKIGITLPEEELSAALREIHDDS